MRISVVGTSGSGKTTFAARLADAFDLPQIELDALNWQAGWRDLVSHDPVEFVRRVDEATAGARWVCAGNYSGVRDIVWGRATHLIWLDYERPLIMARVISRSLARAVDRRELWPGTGNRETIGRWLDPGHPIRWAWDTFELHRAEYEALIASPQATHLHVFRLRRPRETRPLLEALRNEMET